LAAVHGAEALQPVDPDRLNDPAVMDLADRIDLAAHDDFADSFPQRTPCRVIIDMGDGPRSLTVLDPVGDVANPMSRVQVTEKFRRISAANIKIERQNEILAALEGLLEQGFGPLFAVLTEPRPILGSRQSNNQQRGIWDENHVI